MKAAFEITKEAGWMIDLCAGGSACAVLFFSDFGDECAGNELGSLHAEARAPDFVAHAIAHPDDGNGSRPWPWVLTFDGLAWETRQLDGGSDAVDA
jgi:hypothetical protein